jgi:hypothetical protein
MSTQKSLKNKLSNTKAVSQKIQSERLESENIKYDKVDLVINNIPVPKKTVRKLRAPVKEKYPASEMQKTGLNYTNEEQSIIHDLIVKYAVSGTVFTTSEIFRLGIHALKGMSDNQLKKLTPSLERFKRGKKA